MRQGWKYIFIHGLGQGPDSWNKTVSCMREQEEIQCLNVFALKDGEEISYSRVSVSYTHLDVYKRQLQI